MLLVRIYRFKQQVQTDIKAVWSKIYFSSEKMCFDISSLKSFPNNFHFFLLFLTFLIDFQLLCILAVLVVSQQVFE